MKLNNVTPKQKKILNKLSIGSDAINQAQREIELLKKVGHYSIEYIIEQTQMRNTAAADIYINNLNEVIEELENYKAEVKWEEQSDNKKLYDMMFFKEILEKSSIADLVQIVKENNLNKTYIDLFKINYNKLEKMLIEVQDRSTLEELIVLNTEINNYGKELEYVELLKTLIPIRETGSIWLNLDKMDEEETQVIGSYLSWLGIPKTTKKA